MSPLSRSLIGLGALGFAVWALGPAHLSSAEAPRPERYAAPTSGMLAVDLVDGASEADLQAIEARIGADLGWVSADSIDEALAEGMVPDLAAAVAALARDPLVEAVEPVEVLTAFGLPATPDDPLYDRQWNMKAMGAPSGWTQTPAGAGVIVAVIDTGVTKVEDLGGTTILEGKSFVPGTKSAADDQGHGTHVAGTIAQTTHNGKGVAGVAPGASILPVKVLSSSGSGTSTWIASGIDWAADNGAQVINMSLGGPYSAVVHTAVKKARAKGVIVVAAVGNSGGRGVSYPGGLAEVIGVSAVGPDGVLAPYSSYGQGVDISAPGGNKQLTNGGILQDTVDLKGGHVYAEYQGTSMATPHVAGAAAVLLSTGLPANEVEQALLRSAQGSGSWDEKYGSGQLSLATALGNAMVWHDSLRFFLGIFVAVLVGGLASKDARKVRPAFRVAAPLLAGIFAGGLFMADFLPFGGALVQLIASPLLAWPAAWLPASWIQLPFWTSALLPLVATVTVGLWRFGRPLAFAVSVGVGVHLIHGAVTGELEPLWLPTALGQGWLYGNGLAALLMAMALAGAEKIDGGAK